MGNKLASTVILQYLRTFFNKVSSFFHEACRYSVSLKRDRFTAKMPFPSNKCDVDNETRSKSGILNGVELGLKALDHYLRWGVLQ